MRYFSLFLPTKTQLDLSNLEVFFLGHLLTLGNKNTRFCTIFCTMIKQSERNPGTEKKTEFKRCSVRGAVFFGRVSVLVKKNDNLANFLLTLCNKNNII